MKQIVAILILLVVTVNCNYNQTNSTDNQTALTDLSVLKDMLLFAQGFQGSIGYYNNVTDYYPCLSYLGIFLNELVIIIDYGKSGDIVDLLKELPLFLSSAQQANITCRSTIDETGVFYSNIGSRLQQQWKQNGWVNLLLNKNKVQEDIDQANESAALQFWYDVGIAYGDIFNIFLYGKSQVERELIQNIDWNLVAKKATEIAILYAKRN